MATPDRPSREGKTADLVLAGGGVRGVGLAGAVDQLADAGYGFQRVAGTSAGAITGAIIAAMVQAGAPVQGIAQTARTIDYASFRDAYGMARWAGPLRPLADGMNVLTKSGLYKGERLREWIAHTLAAYGVTTFGDLRLPPDPDSDLPQSHRYRLVVMASDVSRQRAIRLPWDYHRYGLDPDEQSVADAVRMSAGIPFYFRPRTLRAADGEVCTVVDGGLFTAFPVTVFDRTDGKPPRWPTFGIQLIGSDDQARTRRIRGPLSLALGVVESTVGSWDAMYIDNPCTKARSVLVDTGTIATTDFGITPDEREWLISSGQQAARDFLASWDFSAYLRRCHGGAQ